MTVEPSHQRGKNGAFISALVAVGAVVFFGMSPLLDVLTRKSDESQPVRAVSRPLDSEILPRPRRGTEESKPPIPQVALKKKKKSKSTSGEGEIERSCRAYVDAGVENSYSDCVARITGQHERMERCCFLKAKLKEGKGKKLRVR